MVLRARCPVCRRELPGIESPEANRLAPFCSDRCRKVDLMRWFDGKYAIVEPITDETLQHLAESGELPNSETFENPE